ncbi:MAG: DUF4932 domain-containing protein [Verrucomicrobiales bacterium]
MKTYRLFSYAILLMAFLFTSCSFHANRWSSNNPPGLYEASFENFSGNEVNQVQVDSGDLFFLSANVDQERGKLTISVVSKGTNLWQHSFASSINESVQIQLPVAEPGEYKVRIVGDKSTGKFHITYRSVPAKKIEVKIAKNVELFGLLMQLDIAPEILSNTNLVDLDGRKAQWRDWYAPAVLNFERYKSFSDGSMMKIYRDYISRGFYNDFFIGFLLQVDEAPLARLRPDTDTDIIKAFSKTGNQEEGRVAATAFLDALNLFYHEIKFDAHLLKNESHYKLAKTAVANNLPPASFVAIMEDFYQKQFNQYCMIPSLNIPTSMGFGKMHHKAGVIYNIFGPFGFQNLDQNPADLGFDFPEKILHLSAHEFGHSFVNPAIDKLSPDLIKSSEHLFTPIKDAMTTQSYPTWNIALCEHFVRAGEIIIARKLGDEAGAARNLQKNLTNGFIYLPAIVSELEYYERDLHRQKNYDEFVPLVINKLIASGKTHTQ